MAKAKKTEANETKTAAKKSGKPKAALPAATPLIDTTLAAESAAKFVGAKLPTTAAGAGISSARESATFKHMKEGLNKPGSSSLASLLDKGPGGMQKKPNLPFMGGKQVGRNQTFGADVNRAGVPRRTGGG